MAFSGGAGADLGSARGTIEISTDGAQRALKQLQGSVQSFSSSSESAFGRIATGLGLLAGSRAIAGIFSGGVSAAADFEAQVSAIAAVAGATGEQLDQLREKALQLGKDTSFSASEAASAIEELAKAGVPLEDILSGAADGATALAAAAGVSLPQAAIIMANAMNIFGLAGNQATHVADLFAAASNKSAADADGLAQALAQVGSVADLAGLSIEDTVGALAFLADNALKGSDAGTSLKTALTSMLAPVGEGATAIETLGLNFRDAQGNFVGLAGAADELRRVLGPLSKAEQDAALRAIFGSDAIRVGNALFKNGGDVVRDYTSAVNDSGAAQENATKRLDNFNGAVEQLRGSIETAAIIIGTALLPALKEIVQGVTAVVNAFVDMPGPVQAVLAGLVGASGVIAGLAGAIVLAGPKMAAFGEALKTIRVALLGFAAANPIVLAVVAALALLGLAYKTNFGGFADAVNGAIDKVKEFGKVFARSFAFSRSLPEIGNLGAAFAAVGQAMTEILGINVYKQFRTIGNIADRIGKSLNRMSRQFGVLSRAIKRGGLAEGFDQLFGKIGTNLLAEFGDLIGALPRTVGTALRQITTGIDPVDTALHNLGSGFIQFGRAVENVFSGNFDTAIKNLQNAGQRFKAIGIQLGTIAISGVPVLAGVLADLAKDAWAWVKGNIHNILDAALALGELAISAAVSLAGTIKDFAEDAWAWVFGNFHNVVDATKTLGTLLIDGTVQLEQTLANFAADVWGFIIDTFQNVGDAAKTLGTLTIDGAVALGTILGEVMPDVWGWIKTHAENTLDSILELGTLYLNGTVAFVSSDDFSLTAESIGQGIVDAIVSLGTLANDIGTAIADKVTSIDWLGFATSGSFGSGESFGAALRQLIINGVKALGQIDAGDVADVFLKVGEALFKASLAFPAAIALVTTAIVSFIAGAIKGLIFGEGDIDWSGTMNGIVSSFTGALDGIRDKIVGAITGLFTGGATTEFKRTLGGGKFVTSATSGLFDGLVDALKLPDIPTPELPDWLTNTGWLTGPITTLTNTINKAIGPLQKAWDAFSKIKDLFTGSGSNELPKVQQPNVNPDTGLPQGEPIPDDAPRKFIEFAGAIDTVGASLTTFAQTVSDNTPTIQQGIRDILASLGGGSGGAVAGAGAALKGFADKLTLPAPDLSALTSGLGKAVDATREAMSQIVETAAAVVAPLASAGQNAAQGFAAGIANGMRVAIGAAANGAAQVVNAARSQLGSLGPAGFGVGQSLGFGIASGISSTIGSVVSAAVNLVFTAVNAAKFAAQIASPSKLMAKEIGVPLAQGVALGIDTGAGTVQHSLASLIGGLVPTSTSTSRMVGSQPVGAAASGARGASVVNVFALHPDDWVQYANMARRGSEAGDFVDDLPRSYGLMFGGGV